ncbi:MAG: PQQ-dependent sugar dehydrogenase [Spirosomaceae bacterium]|nr:PQQ-dependent sugar dehydrogenase [Spirosomataceae bacterium]
MNVRRLLVILVLGWVRPLTFAQNPTISLDLYASNFTRPTDVESAGDARLFVSEIGGKIKVIQNDTVLNTPFVDISSKINNPQWSGIFSFAFHPDYAQNGKIYVMYVRSPDAQVQISQFNRSTSDPNQADPTEFPILTIPYNNPIGHRGGEIAFGQDGYLYIATGDNADGGRAVVGDPLNQAQNLALVFGKILRIDVNSATPYNIPTTNPYQSPNDNIPDEIWARGLRNPWRMTFDKLNGDLWLGDNGQDGWEEVDFVANGSAGGQNFGWRCYEGNHRYPYQVTCDDSTTMTFPLLEYAGFDHNGGNTASVIGGYVYRGAQHPSLYGHYLYGDYASGKIWTLKRELNGTYTNVLQSPNLPNLIAFGQDSSGELYAISFFGGNLYKIKTDNCPPTLSLTAPVGGTQNFKASLQIEGQNTIESGANITYQAGNSIVLLPNFQVVAGSVFKATIAGCP